MTDWSEERQREFFRYITQLAEFETNEGEHPRNKESSVVRDFIKSRYLCSAGSLNARYGYPDCVDDERVYEVKRCSDWKHALGQALAYAFDLSRKPVIVLFDCERPIIYHAADVCAAHGVELIVAMQQKDPRDRQPRRVKNAPSRTRWVFGELVVR
jgi:hypothetical protein